MPRGGLENSEELGLPLSAPLPTPHCREGAWGTAASRSEMREGERSALGPSLLPAVMQMDGFNQGRPRGPRRCNQASSPQAGASTPPCSSLHSSLQQPPLRPRRPRLRSFSLGFCLSAVLLLQLNLISILPSVHLSSLCRPLPLCPHAGPPEAFQSLGPQPGASLPHWPPLRDALPQAHAPSSVTVHGVTAASCWLLAGEGVLLPCSLAAAPLRPPFIHSFIHARFHSVREESWGLCQEPCTALCYAGGTEYRGRYPQPLRGLVGRMGGRGRKRKVRKRRGWEDHEEEGGGAGRRGDEGLGRAERGTGPPWLQAEVQMLPASLCSS